MIGGSGQRKFAPSTGLDDSSDSDSNSEDATADDLHEQSEVNCLKLWRPHKLPASR